MNRPYIFSLTFIDNINTRIQTEDLEYSGKFALLHMKAFQSLIQKHPSGISQITFLILICTREDTRTSKKLNLKVMKRQLRTKLREKVKEQFKKSY